MNHNDTRQSGETGTMSKADEAELIAEILSRMDKNRGENVSGSAPRRNGAQTIDLVELFYFYLSKLYIIILAMVAGGVLMGIYASFTSTPIYTATSKLYIIGSTGSSIVTNIQIGAVLTPDYEEVFQTWEVHQMVNEELGTDYTYTQLQSMITVTNPEDTRILYITARSTDPQSAADIANAYAKAAKKFIVETMNTDEPSTFSVALVPSVSSGGGITGKIIRGMLLGTVLAGGILLLIFLLDNRPKSPEDIMRYANLPTLAVIPLNKQLTGENYGGRKGDRA